MESRYYKAEKVKKDRKKDYKITTVALPVHYFEIIDKILRVSGFNSRSEVIRNLIREALFRTLDLERELKALADGEIAVPEMGIKRVLREA